MMKSTRRQFLKTASAAALTASMTRTGIALASEQPDSGREYHVAVDGADDGEGSEEQPLRTISEAARRAKPGDTITVHEGTYRERIDPPRGGVSDKERIVYRAAPGEEVVIKGSEPMQGWEHVGHDTWKVRVPNDFFGDFNPYSDEIHGDWFNPLGRTHHTGAVYLDGHWLTEAAARDDTLEPVGDRPPWRDVQAPSGFLLNVVWFRPGEAERVLAVDYANQSGIDTASSTEGVDCIGWIEHGDWVRYEGVDFGESAEELEIRASSAAEGGVIEIRLDEPDGELLGEVSVPNTGGWQEWESFTLEIAPTSGTQTVCLAFKNSVEESAAETAGPAELGLWFAEVDETETVIWAQFKDTDPNEADVEINVRQAVFYPSEPGRDYITVRGFTMMQAATPWAPPTAEQVGLIGAHWSRGWIIEDNDIRYSTCVGVTLGKYGDEWDNTSEDTAEGYVETIERALEDGWSKENIGHHIVRNNRISHCEQAGLVGSMGAVFSTVTRNEIHDIHIRRLFTGAEMAGIKIHGAVDGEISHNHIYRTTRGIWLDWMTQGTRVTRNVLHDNGPQEDFFIEVNHGPFLLDHNLALSGHALSDWSQGGAYAHNLLVGHIHAQPVLGRETPFLEPHSTEVAGLQNHEGGDNRFHNNIFVGGPGLTPYDDAAMPVDMSGNVFYNGAEASEHEAEPVVRPAFDPEIRLFEEEDGVYLEMTLDSSLSDAPTQRVTTERLGEAAIPGLPFRQPDGSAIDLGMDYFGETRSESTPTPGPFENPGEGTVRFKVW